MEAETMNSPQTKDEFQKIIKSYKKEIEMLKTQVRKDEDEYMYKYEKEALLQHQKVFFLSSEKRQNNVEQIEMQNNKLHGGLQQLYESDQLADGIEQNLHSQTEKMIGSMGKLKQVFGELTTSNRYVTDIKNRIIKNKAICYGVLILIILVVVLIVLYKFL